MINDAKLVWDPKFKPKSDEMLTRVQRFVDEEVLRLSNPLVPYRTGLLKLSGEYGTKAGSGEVKYSAPYARYLYYGRVMAGRAAPKHITGKAIRYAGGPVRGAMWFERMKARYRELILMAAAKLARRLGI